MIPESTGSDPSRPDLALFLSRKDTKLQLSVHQPNEKQKTKGKEGKEKHL